jgi:hypothetical protein
MVGKKKVRTAVVFPDAAKQRSGVRSELLNGKGSVDPRIDLEF